MRTYIPLFLLSLLACGCVAGAANKAKQLDADEEEIEYIRSHDRPPYIDRAIERGQVVIGMTPEDVEFVMGEPKSKSTEGDRVTWLYGTVSQRTRVVFEDGKVAEMPN